MPNNAIKKIKSAPKLYFLVLTLFIVFAFVFIFFANKPNNVNANINNKNYSLVVLETEPSRTKGLSGMQSLKPNTGMLFDFKQDGNWQIWMKDMNFAIDILWLNNQKQVVGVKQNALPQDYPEIYSADSNSMYVIELPTGSVESTNLKIGDFISW